MREGDVVTGVAAIPHVLVVLDVDFAVRAVAPARRAEPESLPRPPEETP